MLDFAFGSSRNPFVTDELVKLLESFDLSGTLYIGYPLLTALEGSHQLDALLTCSEFGVIAFDLSCSPDSLKSDEGIEAVEESQNDIWVNLNSKLVEHKSLRSGRKLAFDIQVISFVPEINDNPENDHIVIASPETLHDVLKNFNPLPEDLVVSLNAAIQHTTTIKPRKKRANVSRDDSKGNTLKTIEAEIANLDAWQKRGAIEYPEGPQRIRGLAGSGKTIVLAQKAAFLHAKHPDWKIAVTFQTRSLYQQFRNLIRKFSFDMIRDEPDWNNLRVIHAWGSYSSPGIYSEIARSADVSPVSFGAAKDKFGISQAFRGVCTDLNAVIKDKPIEPMFDAVLIDEAQDFPEEFFHIVYEAVAAPKRVVWAYDELQNLSDFTMSPAEKLFGNNADGTPRVQLTNQPGRPLQDIVLPTCYRNTPWALATAHALGFGIYRSKGLAQMFDDPGLWDAIGYEEKGGAPKAGERVTFARKANASPSYFSDLLEPSEAIQCKVFNSEEEEFTWVTDKIKKNIEDEELDADDILVIIANPLKIRPCGAKISRFLKERGITSHLAGVTTSRDALFYEKSVAITSIYRAKGNEAPMVYVVGANYCYDGFDLATKRNTVFTAITRSRAWVRVSGVGLKMANLKREVDNVVDNEFQLAFIYPTAEEISNMRLIHRDRTVDEKKAIGADLEGLIRTIERIEKGELDPDSLPDDVRQVVERLASRPEE